MIHLSLRARSWLAACFLAAAGLLALPVSGSAVADEVAAAETVSANGPVLMAASVGGYWDRFMNYVSASVHGRRRMIQVVTIGACIGLFIMLRNKH